jgi:adenylyltransferase/sulfurtransferase
MRHRRYHKQILFAGLGLKGQARLKASSVLVAGVGALGGAAAAMLVRAGVGRVRIVDRDAPELSNLHRQILYEEGDLAASTPKAELAFHRLTRANGEVSVEAVAAEIDPANIGELMEGMDLVVDGLDNQYTRYIVNDEAVRLKIPYIYAGVVAASGNVMPLIPGVSPCLRCIFPKPAPPGAIPGCDQVGVIGPAAVCAASIASAEAMKLLSGGPPGRIKMTCFDLWSGAFREIFFDQGPDPACPVCGRPSSAGPA